MVSVDMLDSEIRRRHADADSKRKLADSLLASAESHEASGNHTQAKIDRESAERYLRDAELEENQAGVYEVEIGARRMRAHQIDKEIESVRHEYDRKLADLENKKKSLLG